MMEYIFKPHVLNFDQRFFLSMNLHGLKSTLRVHSKSDFVHVLDAIIALNDDDGGNSNYLSPECGCFQAH
jgi:hypothetical protein